MNLSLRITALAALLSPFALAQSVEKPDPAPQGPEVPPVEEQEAAEASPPNAWFKKTELDLGTFLEGELAKGHFDFENPHDHEIVINSFRASCTCSKAIVRVGEYGYELSNAPRPNSIYRVTTSEDGVETRDLVDRIPVAPHEEGSIDFEIDLRGVQGTKTASVTLHTSDDKNPMIVVSGKATAAHYFQVNPPEINLNEMSWRDEREFTARITSPIRPDFEITGIDGELPAGMTVSYEKEMQGDASVWVVRGKYGPNLDPASAGGLVKLKTDLEGKKVELRVIAFVKGPLEVRPSTFLAFGRVPHGEGASKSVEFDPTGDFDLQVESVEFKNLTFPAEDIGFEVTKDGKIVKLTISIAPETPKQLVRGDVIVHLNHPAVPSKHLQFNGFVR